MSDASPSGYAKPLRRAQVRARKTHRAERGRRTRSASAIVYLGAWWFDDRWFRREFSEDADAAFVAAVDKFPRTRLRKFYARQGGRRAATRGRFLH